ncbi:hypothetical protein SCLCIDRAFT_205434 [Scleroderma citrinum Foug A]|uniref:Uncharacterized protein n=1 Tax=Scleroderma citrinum Foug A TaxID=1036808 RepID=A0A0C2Z4B5_9AGAM|nr:hypothetical protein SCLCIDRAFT_205434 [Scleroderma citrinum Foug A]
MCSFYKCRYWRHATQLLCRQRVAMQFPLRVPMQQHSTALSRSLLTQLLTLIATLPVCTHK